MSKDKTPSEDVQNLVTELAELLKEKEPQPIHQIKRIIQLCGVEFARALYAETAKIEAEGGLMLADNSRRRTPGGVFFFLARLKTTDKQRQAIFPTYGGARGTNQLIPRGIPLLTWSERIALIQSLQTEQGEIESMKIIIRGRPGRIEKRPEVVVTTMSFVASVPNLPRGIPTPPSTPTMYTVYMALKQWEKVEESMADPADMLLLEGICAFDSDTNSMAIFSTSVRSELMEAKAREAQIAASSEKAPKEKAQKQAPPKKDAEPKAETKPAASAQPAQKSAKKSRIADIQSVEPVLQPVVPLNPNLPPDVARKLTELHASATLFRQKVATILSKPAGQQFGLDMTQKLLKNVEDEIAALEKKHSS